MTDYREMPRVYINWDRFRPTTWRDWLAIIGFVAVVIAGIAFAVVIASTLFVIAIIVGIVAAAALFISYMLSRIRGRRRRQIKRIDDASD